MKRRQGSFLFASFVIALLCAAAVPPPALVATQVAVIDPDTKDDQRSGAFDAVVDAAGALHVAWVNAREELWVATMMPSGDRANAKPRPLSIDKALRHKGASLPALAAGVDGRVHLAYLRRSPRKKLPWQVVVDTRSSRGDWSTRTIAGIPRALPPQLAVSRDGRAHLAFSDEGKARVDKLAILDGKRRQIVRLPDVNATQALRGLAFTKDDSARFLYVDVIANRSTLRWTTSSRPAQWASTNTLDTFHAALQRDADGGLLVTHIDGTDQLRAHRLEGDRLEQAWSVVLPHGVNPALGFGSDGARFVASQQHTNSGSRLLLSVSPAKGGWAHRSVDCDATELPVLLSGKGGDRFHVVYQSTTADAVVLRHLLVDAPTITSVPEHHCGR